MAAQRLHTFFFAKSQSSDASTTKTLHLLHCYLVHLLTSHSLFSRSLKNGKNSFVLSSARDVGKLRSVQVQLNGYGSFLKKVVVHSKATNKR